jgi:hypothetical protein
LNTVERRKIRSGSSAAWAGTAGHNDTHRSASKAQSPHLTSYGLKAWNVMDISVAVFTHVGALALLGKV